MNGAIVVKIGEQEQVFHDRFTVGRQGTLRIDDEYASNHHTAFYPEGSEWMAEDLESMNGTWLNRERIYSSRPLGKGDTVRIGRTVLTVVPTGPVPTSLSGVGEEPDGRQS